MEPDAFLTFTERAAVFFSEHKNLLIGAVVGIVAVAAINVVTHTDEAPVVVLESIGIEKVDLLCLHLVALSD